MGATHAILESSFLVKKVVFRVELLPMVKLMSAFIVHGFFVGVIFLMFAVYGYTVSIYNVQFLYYAGAMFCLCLGISWLTSALTVFLRDVGQFVSLILQLGNAHLLEFKHDTDSVSDNLETKSCLLHYRGLSPELHLP